MQTVFIPSRDDAKAPVSFGSFSVVKQAMRRNLLKVQQYYRDRSLAVKSNHLLCRIVNSLAINYLSDVNRFYNLVDARASSIAMAFNLTSDTFAGQLHDGVFYGEGFKEIIISDTSFIDVKYCENNWKTLSPVRIISHPKTDIEMHIPNGLTYSKEIGLAVISVHIPMLLIMYRSFVHEQLEVLQKGGQAKTLAQFINTYVLPNTLGSHVDLAIINRCMCLSLGNKPAIQTARKHPFTIETVHSQLDSVLKDVNSYLNRVNYNLSDMVLLLPCLSSKDASHALKLPSISPTYQYAWVEVVSRAHYLAWFMFMSPNNLKTYNKQLLQHVSRTISYDGIKTEIEKRLPEKLAQETINIIEGINQVAKSV